MSQASPDAGNGSDAPAAQRLAQSLELVLPALPAELVQDGSLGWLRAAANVLPPVHRAGFECRLTEGEDDVDLQLGVFASEDEPARLARFLAAAEPLAPAWERVTELASRWASREDALHGRISELWLELDSPADEPRAAAVSAPRAGAPLPPSRGGVPLSLAQLAPSVFAVLEPAGARASLEAVTEVVRTLATDAEAGALTGALSRFAGACPAPARVSHVGLMLGRPITAMRAHVSPLPPAALPGYLAAIGWPGDPARVQEPAEVLLDLGDLMVLCLDVVGGQVVRLGLECFLSQTSGLDPRWGPLLQRLTGLGLCAAEKAAALLDWPGTVTPLDASGPWPENLLVQSAGRRPEVELGAIDRRLSHVKLTCPLEGPVTAKAYFGYGHVWLGDDPAPEVVSGSRQGPGPRRPVPDRRGAIEAAIDHLLAARNQGGWWRDFFARGRPAGEDRRLIAFASDEWVTAFVATALAATGSPRASGAARDALELLLRRDRPAPGWGYHALLPADAETTIWVLRLAAALGVGPVSARLAEGERLLADLTGSDGGVHTYPASAADELAGFFGTGGSADGWCGEHICVTAGAAVVQRRSAERLLAAQQADGSWRGHWWEDDEYTTARAVEALAAAAGEGAGLDGARAAVERAARWSAGRIGPDGGVFSDAHGGPSPFATALALRAVRVAGGRPTAAEMAAAAARAQGWLLERQLGDGSWEPSALARRPAPDGVDPGRSPERTLTYVDEEGLVTTATVLAALVAGEAC